MRLTAVLNAPHRMTNAQLLARLDTSARRHDIHGAWHWYQVLLRRRTHEESNHPSISTDSRIVPRRQQHSTLEYPLDDTMLSTLSHKYLRHYSASDLSTLRRMISAALANLQRSGGTLSAARLVQLLDVCAANGDSEGGALADALWQQAALSGVARDAACYNAYANAKMRSGQLAEAAEVVREMDDGRAGVRGTSYTKMLAIRLHGYSGDLAEARRVFESVRMGLEGPQRPVADYMGDSADLGTAGLNVETYDAMLDVLGMNGMLDEMFRLFAELAGHPSAGSLEQLVSLVSSDGAKRGRRGLRPHLSTFYVLLRWHAKYWDVAGCIRWIEAMSAFGLRPEARILNMVVTQENAVRELQL
ncbi:hypothetical protein LPJ53_005800, partial [Coemansia erecta]